MVRDRDCKILSWRIFDEIVEIFSVEGTDRENEFFHIFAVDFVREKWKIVEVFCWKDLGRIRKIRLGWMNVKTKIWEGPAVELFVRHLTANFGEFVIRILQLVKLFPLKATPNNQVLRTK